MKMRLPSLRPRLAASFALASLLAAGASRAATVTWTGGASGAWETPGSWSAGRVPGAGDDVVIDGAVTVVTQEAATAGTLTIGHQGGAARPSLVVASTLDVGAATLWSGSLIVAAGPVRATAGVFVRGGIYSSAGPLVGNLDNDGGWVNPNGLSVFTVSGSYRQSARSGLVVLANGTVPGVSLGQLAVSGSAILDGFVLVGPYDTYQPAAGDSFRVLAYGARSGRFSYVQVGAFASAVCFRQSYGSGALTLTSTTASLPAPVLTSFPTAPVTAGSRFTLAWSPVFGTAREGRYEVLASAKADCSAPRTFTTTDPSLTVPTEAGQDASYCIAVRAVSSDGCASDASPPVVVQVKAALPSFEVVKPQRPLAVANQGQPATATSSVAFRNVGASPGSLQLAAQGGFFSVAPAEFPDVAPGQTVVATLSFSGASTVQPGIRLGRLVGAWQVQGQPRGTATPVLLAVLPGTPLASSGSRPEPVGTNEIHFRTYGPGSPTPRQATIRNTGSKALRLTPAIGPGGAWLSVSGDFTTPLAPGEERAFTLSVDRTLRSSADGPPPLVTLLRFQNADGTADDTTDFQVFDEELPTPASGSGRPALAPGETSLVFGSSVSAQGAGATFVSDGWIRNGGSDPAPLTVYYSPDGAADADSLKSSFLLPAYTTVRLSDFVQGLFERSGSGHVEVRSPALASLSVRTTVDSLVTKGGIAVRYGAEIPVVTAGQGVGSDEAPGASLFVTGIRGGAGAPFRTNVILAETSGRGATVLLRLRDAAGSVVSEVQKSVAAHSKLQVNATDTTLFPSAAAYDHGSLEVVRVAGTGTVAAFATVIDNASQAYTTRLGRFLPSATAPSSVAIAAPGLRAGTPADAPLLAASATTLRAVLPAAARTEGVNDSFFTTSVSLTNGSAEAASVQLTYRPDVGDPVGPLPLTVAARATVTLDDVVGTFFHLATDTAGTVLFEGDDLARLTVASDTSTPIDRSHPEKGVSLSTLAWYSDSSPEVFGAPESGASANVVSHPGLEESAQFRTNLVLAEVTGQPATVRVRITAKGSGGAPLADREVSLPPFGRVQINRFLRDLTGQPDAELVDVETSVEAESGTGRVVVLATKIANDPSSKRSDIYVFRPTGEAQGAIGF